MNKSLASLFLLAASSSVAYAAPASGPNMSAIIMFLIFIAGTMGITWWAARRTQTTADFYTAGGGISGFQNGLAIAGDYLSAASFLGIAGMVYVSGFDGMIYAIGFMFGWPVVMFLIAERLRNLGRYNFADVTAFRLKQTPMRVLAASASLLIIALYLIAQMVGAGKLIVLLFNINYTTAVLIVAALIASSGVIFILMQASEIIMGMLPLGALPGL